MKNIKLNEIPGQVSAGILSEKEAVFLLAEFTSENPALFGLHRYDEDFRSEVILALLEKSDGLFPGFRAFSGNFFNYFYTYVNNIICTKRRQQARRNVIETLTTKEFITSLPEKEDDYGRIRYADFSQNRIPYSFRKPDARDLKIAVATNTYRIKKYINSEPHSDEHLKTNLRRLSSKSVTRILIILALRSASSINDDLIQKICRICGIDRLKLYDGIQYCREQIALRTERKKKAEERRNAAYFYHKKYRAQISYLEENCESDFKYLRIEELRRKYARQTSNWEKSNRRLSDGYLALVPTIKDISEVLSLSERQVCYYLASARRLMEEDPASEESDELTTPNEDDMEP